MLPTENGSGSIGNGRMADRLNVLVVVIDGARADHLSCYGYGRETTPFLDTVAREGVRFPHMISTAASTLPSLGSLFTGLFPSSHGATDEHPSLPACHATMAEVFRAAGYRTAVFCANPWVRPGTGFLRGFDHHYTPLPRDSRFSRLTSRVWKAADRLLRRADGGGWRLNRRLADWVSQSGAPFFAFVHYSELRPESARRRARDRLFMPPGINRRRIRAVRADGDAYLAGAVDLSVEDIAVLTALYDGALRYVDDRVREVGATLKKRNLWERTVFILTADHGEGLGEHHMIGHKLALSDTLLRVPLLIRCPALVPEGYVVDEFAQTCDVFPTAAHLVGLDDHMPAVQGRPLIRDRRATPGASFAIAERFRPTLTGLTARFPEFDPLPHEVRKKAIRTKREKFIWHSDEDNEYYNLVADPGEQHNLAYELPARSEHLRRQLFDWLASIERFAGDNAQPAVAPLAHADLRAAGSRD